MNRFPWQRIGDTAYDDRLLIICKSPTDIRAAYLWSDGVGHWSERRCEAVAMGTSLDSVLAELLEKVNAAQT